MEKNTVTLLLQLSLVISFWSVTTGNARINTNVCERKTAILRCPKPFVILIHDANYGRTDKFICPGTRSRSTTTCGSAVSRKIVSKTCDGKRTCILAANNHVFGDPCDGVYKFLRVSYSCIEYLIFHTKKSWYEARKECRKVNADLVTIGNENVNNHLKSLLRSNSNYWIGLNDIGAENNFTWISSGSPLSLFINWDDGEPNNNGKNEHCVEIRGWRTFMWNDKFCQQKSGYICERGNLPFSSDYPIFMTHPFGYSINVGQEARLTCYYYNYKESTFDWMKDGQVLEGQKVTNGYYNMRTQRQNNTTLQSLSFRVSDPDMQGFYSCMVNRLLDHSFESNQALVRLKDVSTTKMSLKINMDFEPALLNKTSREYIVFEKDVISLLNATLYKRGITERKSFALRKIRSGSVLADVYVYFMGLNNLARTNLCSNLRNLPASVESGSLQITSLNITMLDCCDSSQTGEKKLKGVIIWPITIAGTNSEIVCPYNINNPINNTIVKNAVRLCKSDFTTGAQWAEPNIIECPYKTRITQQLATLSSTSINQSNAEQISKQLIEITKDPERITNRLDVNFTADIIIKLVNVDQKLNQVSDNILEATSSILSVKKTIIVQSQTQYNSSARLLVALQSLADNLLMENNETAVIVKRNLAMGVKIINPKKTSGLLIQAAATSQSNVNNITFSDSDSNVTRKEDIASIYLSELLFNKAEKSTNNKKRITTFIFDNEKLFLSQQSIDISSGNKVNVRKFVTSKILSASIKDVKLANLTGGEQVRSTFSAQHTKGMNECVFWDFNGKGGQGSWSTLGCWSDGYIKNTYQCRCDHLTNFALLFDISGDVYLPPEAQLALSIITYIGCGISLAALAFTFLTFTLFRKLRKYRPMKILMHLCFALIALMVILLASFEAQNKLECQAVSLLIHYFVLVSFCWMAVEGFNFYLCFVKVLGGGVSKFLWKASLFAYGLPLIIVSIAAGVTKLDNHATQRNGQWICMVKGIPFYAAYLAPILIIVTGNIIVLSMVLCSLSNKSEVTRNKHMDTATKVRIAAACSVLMGVTWIVGLFAVNELTLTFQLIFCVFNSLQGFFIFIFYCARNKEVRKEWKKLFCCGSDDHSSCSGFHTRGHTPRFQSKGYNTNQTNKEHTDNVEGCVIVSTGASGAFLSSVRSDPAPSSTIRNDSQCDEEGELKITSTGIKETAENCTLPEIIKMAPLHDHIM